MICCWDGFLSILPPWLRTETDPFRKDNLQELRLRSGSPAELIFSDRRQFLRQTITREDLSFCINTASQYSPWASATIAEGYLTAKGGHRIGICGEMILKDGKPAGIRSISSLSIRIARDFPGIADPVKMLQGSVLILGAPGWGKTTLLRDLIRHRSARETVAVIDERKELFPAGFEMGLQTDLLTCCPKRIGISQVLRTMGPQTIAVDEITEKEDTEALLQAQGCGVSLLASAHAGSLREFQKRKVYEPLIANKVFEHVLILRKDQTYQAERMST